MTEKYTTAALANKVDWEGSVLDAMEYGITADDIEDADVALLWQDAQYLYWSLQPILGKIQDILDNVAEE